MEARLRALLVLLVVALAGCTAMNPEEASRRRGFQYVLETGSNIPKKVPLGAPSDGSQNIEKVDGTAFSRLQQDQVTRGYIRPGR